MNVLQAAATKTVVWVTRSYYANAQWRVAIDRRMRNARGELVTHLWCPHTPQKTVQR